MDCCLVPRVESEVRFTLFTEAERSSFVQFLTSLIMSVLTDDRSSFKWPQTQTVFRSCASNIAAIASSRDRELLLAVRELQLFLSVHCCILLLLLLRMISVFLVCRLKICCGIVTDSPPPFFFFKKSRFSVTHNKKRLWDSRFLLRWPRRILPTEMWQLVTSCRILPSFRRNVLPPSSVL
jgi:hypothetical protein